MPELSKECGVSFNGFSVNNEKGYFLTGVSMPLKPAQEYTAQYLPGRSETIYGSGGYKDIPINVSVGIRYSSQEDRINKINAICAAWCFTESKLRFKHNDFYYVGKILDEVSPSEDGMYTILTFPFICKPFTFSEEHQITLQASNSINYIGDYKCQPKIKFSGTGTHTISCNGETFTLTGDGKSITVDCDKGIVYYDSDISNAMLQFSGDMITFKPNMVNVLTWSATDGSTVPTLIYNDINLCKKKYTEKSY